MSNNRIHRLGRGLSELIPDTAELQKKSYNPDSVFEKNTDFKQFNVPVSSIKPSKFQPRKDFDSESLQELADSIKSNGIIQPIFLRKKSDDDYEIIAGERRWRASIIAKMDYIPAIIKDIDDKTALEISIIENIQREDLNPVEEAQSYKRLIDECFYTHENLSSVIGKSRSHVTNMLRILNLSEQILSSLRNSEISMGHARALIKAKDPNYVLKCIISKSLSVRQTEELIRSKKDVKSSVTQKQKSRNIVMLENALSDRLGMMVSVDESKKGGKGVVKIKFDGIDQLENIMNFLSDVSESET